MDPRYAADVDRQFAWGGFGGDSYYPATVGFAPQYAQPDTTVVVPGGGPGGLLFAGALGLGLGWLLWKR